MIADEMTYFDQAFAWSGGSNLLCPCLPCDAPCTSFRPSDYPPGTSLLATLPIWCAGPKSVFWLGMIAWLAGTWALAVLLHRVGRPLYWALYPWLFAPGLIMPRTLMSDVPSFALAAIFLCLYTGYGHRRTGMILAGLIAGVGLLFRETNILWAAPFLADAVLRRKAYWQYMWLSFGCGIGLRLGVAWLVFDNPFFYKNTGVSFSPAFILKNLGYYLPALIVLLPGGLWLLWKSRWGYRNEALATTILFLLVYGCYGYDAFFKSGYKGIVLQGRFLLPFLPAIAVAAAFGAPKWLNQLTHRQHVAFGGIFLLYTAVQLAGWKYNASQDTLTRALYALPQDRLISFTPDESRKYLNRLHGNACAISGEQLQRDQLACDRVWYIHLIAREDGADWFKKNKLARLATTQFLSSGLPAPVVDIRQIDGARLQVWKVCLPAPNTNAQ